jgi:serine protease Do
MMRYAGIPIVVVSLLAGSLWAGQLKPEEKRALELKPAVVLVVVDFKVKWTLEVLPKPIELEHTETGTGFLFRPDGYLITNGHVVADANVKDQQATEARNLRLRAELLDALQKGMISQYIEGKLGRKLTDAEQDQVARTHWDISIEGDPTLKVILQNGKALDADILQYSPPVDQNGKDVAILKIPGENLPTVTLGNSQNVRLQDQIMVMGYPATAAPWSDKSTSSLISMESGLEPSATNGHISALKTESIGTPLLQSDVAIFHGNSGGPAFNDQGEVIGLATYGAQEAQGFNFLVPINTAMEFVRQSGVAPEIGAFNKHWAGALDQYDDGDCEHAIAEFDNVSQFMPGLRDAQKYRAAAVACVDNMRWYQKQKWPLLALLAIIIVGGGLWLLLSRTGKKGSASGYGRIQFTSGSLTGSTFPIGKEGLWIGRDSGKCAVVLQDDSISSQHAWIVPAEGNIVVIDKGSTNGTYLNSVDSPRISKVGLRNGDRVYLGHKGSAFTYFVA